MRKHLSILLSTCILLTACGTKMPDTTATTASANARVSENVIAETKDVSGDFHYIYREYRGGEQLNTKYFLYKRNNTYDLLQEDYKDGGILLSVKELSPEDKELIDAELKRVTVSSDFSVYDSNSDVFTISANLMQDKQIQPIESIELLTLINPFAAYDGSYVNISTMEQTTWNQIDVPTIDRMLYEHSDGMLIVDQITAFGFADMLLFNVADWLHLPIEEIHIDILQEYDNSFLIYANEHYFRVAYDGLILEEVQ